MIRVFENLKEYNTYTNDGKDLKSGDLYWVNETNSASFTTNNIDGITQSYEMARGGADLEDYYTKSESDGLFATQVVVNEEIAARIAGDGALNTALGTKADKSDTYTKSQVDDALALKQDASTAFSGDYDDLTNKPTIPDTSDFVSINQYNPKELAIAEALNTLNTSKADTSSVYTKTEIDAMIGNINTVLASI